MYIETEGIVIKAVKYSESDLILTILSRKFGKISVYAKGARRVKSPMMSSTQPFALSMFSLTPTSGSFRLQRADLIKNYYKLSSVLDKYYYGSYFMEFCEKVLMENQTNIRLFDLLKDSLEILETTEHYRLLRIIFELKALEYVGLKPEVLKCSNCGIIDLRASTMFNISEGGLVCPSCSNQAKSFMKLDPSTVRLIKYIYENDSKKSSEAKVSDILIAEARNLIDFYFKEHLGILHLKSLDFLM